MRQSRFDLRAKAPSALRRMLVALNGLLLLLTSLPAHAKRSEVEGPCVPGSKATREAEALLTAVNRAHLELHEGSSTAAYVSSVRELRRHRCFKWAIDGWPRIEDVDAPTLRRWWSEGGERWLRSFLSYGPHNRKVALAPDLPNLLSDANRFLLSEVTCEPGSHACAHGDRWRARADTALETAFAACRHAPAPCEERQGLRSKDFFGWLECEDRQVGRSIELPVDRVHPPTDGWLVIRHRREERDLAASCLAASSFALATGDAWILDTCGRPKVRRGKVPLVPLRELALLLAVSDNLQHDARARVIEVELPEGLEPEWAKGSIMGSVRGAMISHALEPLPKISWRLWTARAEKLGSLGPSDCDPLARVARQWLHELEAGLEEVCPTTVPPGTLFERADPGRSVSWERAFERQTYQRLMELMVEPPVGCRGGTASSRHATPYDPWR